MSPTVTRGSKRRKLSPPDEDVKVVPPNKRKPTKSLAANEWLAQRGQDGTLKEKQADDDMLSVKGLDSSDPAIRRSTLKSILEALRSRPARKWLGNDQELQIWRGLFVAIYMHDSKNMLSVQNMLRDVAGTFATIADKDEEIKKEADAPQDVFYEAGMWFGPWHRVFWQTCEREWARIDSHRINKYLLLVRFVMREIFTMCLNQRKNDEVIAELQSKQPKGKVQTMRQLKELDPLPTLAVVVACVETLREQGPLNPTNRKMSDGLRLHVLDIWNEELEGALEEVKKMSDADDIDDKALRKREANLDTILGLLQAPIATMSASDSGAQKHVRTKAKETNKDMAELRAKFAKSTA